MTYDDNNIFAKILRGEVPAYTVYENEHCLAILDVMPQSDGHTLVLPREPAQDLFDLDPKIAGILIQSVQHLAHGIRAAFDPQGIRLMQFNGATAGQTVFHFHMHIVPCYSDRPLRTHARDMEATEVLEENAARIRASLDSIPG